MTDAVNGSRPLKIWHVCAPGPVGGLERVVQALAGGHQRQGHDVHVISVILPHEHDHPFPEPLRAAGVRVTELKLPSKALLKERRMVREIMEKERPDVVHTHGYRPGLIHAPTARKLGIATVATEHGSSFLGGKAAIYEWVMRKQFRKFDSVIAVSTPIVDILTRDGTPRDRIDVVPNGWGGGVDFLDRDAAREKLGLPKDAYVAAYVARLINAKGPDVFVDGFLELDPELPITGFVVGDGDFRPLLDEKVAAAGRGEHIRFAGHLDNAAPLFKAFDLFVLSSRTEGTPIALFEAIAAEVPTVVTRVGGVPDVVTPEESILVDTESPDQIAAAITACYQDQDGARERARLATRRLETEFSADLWLERHEAVYRRISGVG